jgi:tRNA(fMet)-specific endonuclease VapC
LVRDVLLDTNVLVDFFAGDPETVEAFQRSRTLSINTIVLGELLGGFALGSRVEANRRLLSRFLSSSRVRVLPLAAETADHYADVYARLRRKGRPIPSNDMWIAASAREYGLVLFTRDVHFRDVDGLLVAASLDLLLP